MSDHGADSPQPAQRPYAFQKGASIGNYLILKELGRGGMGVVYGAYDTELRREVAIKVLNPEREGEEQLLRDRQRLTREGRATAQVVHPNVVSIYGSGEEQGRKYIVMELLKGGTLRDWINVPGRSWRKVIKLFIEIAEGLGAVHAAGYVHRDFKPENVLLDERGRPRVLDFGLVRRTDAVLSSGYEPPASEPAPLDLRAADPTVDGPAISVAGAWLGTALYMAPEQFRSGKIDARTDQFAFCVTLYEALYGSRPFAGGSRLDIAFEVVKGKILEAPRGSEVPGWVRKIVCKGLSPSPDDRFPSLDELRQALQRDPAIIRRKWLIGAGVVVLALAATSVGYQMVVGRRRELDRRIAALKAESARNIPLARAASEEANAARQAALAAFDRGLRERGDQAWGAVQAKFAAADVAFERAQAALRTEGQLDPDSAGVSDRLVEVILERAALAERQAHPDDVMKRLGELASVDPSGRARARWNRPGTVTLRGLGSTPPTLPAPPALRLALQQPSPTPDGSWQPRALAGPGDAPPAAFELAPGSYRLVITTRRDEIHFLPFLVERGRAIELDLSDVTRAVAPNGFRLIAGGPTLVGEPDEALRRGFCETVPLHELSVRSFAIAENETTNAEWIDYLDHLSTRERALRRPLVSTVQGYVELRRAGRSWTLAMRPTQHLYQARGAKIRYQGRDRLAEQEWRRFPVAGISAGDARAYAAWLASTGRVPGARLCTEIEWERAARGADGRAYPMGNHLGAAQANFDQTYGRLPDAFGPDEVGRHPASNSPFGVADLAGNVWEIVRPSFGSEPIVIRGGGYFHDDASARSSNRHVIDLSARAAYVGVRICSDLTAVPDHN